MGHPVKCYYCGLTFDRDKTPFVAIPDKAKRYAHKDCYDRIARQTEQEQEDKEKLETYIKQLFGYKTLPERVNRQIIKYRTELNYSYSAIYKSLLYFFEIKKSPIEKANGGIGIVPYIIDDARNYWLSILEAQERNKEIKVEQYVLPVREVHILPPQREPMKHTRKLFTFLDEGEEET